MLFINNNNRTREAIRNDREPICWDSVDPDSDVQQVVSDSHSLCSYFGSLKDIRDPARKCQKKGRALAQRFHDLSAEHHS